MFPPALAALTPELGATALWDALSPACVKVAFPTPLLLALPHLHVFPGDLALTNVPTPTHVLQTRLGVLFPSFGMKHPVAGSF